MYDSRWVVFIVIQDVMRRKSSSVTRVCVSHSLLFATAKTTAVTILMRVGAAVSDKWRRALCRMMMTLFITCTCVCACMCVRPRITQIPFHPTKLCHTVTTHRRNILTHEYDIYYNVCLRIHILVSLLHIILFTLSPLVFLTIMMVDLT